MNNNNAANSKAYSQQRAVLKPMKNDAIFEEEELEQDMTDTEMEEEIFMDDSSSSYSGTMAAVAHDSRNETMLLAQFLSTTGPEEYAKQDTKKQQQFKRASRLLSRLRKRPTMPVLRSATGGGAAAAIPNSNNATTASPSQAEKKLNYIPLPVYDYYPADTPLQQAKKESNKKPNTTSTSTNTASHHYQTNKTKKQPQQQQVNNALRDSGIYSETNSEKDSSITSTSTAHGPLPPLPPFTTVMSELQFPHPPYAFKSSSPNNYQQQQQQNNPRRPAPLPPALASAAIATATSVCSSDGGTSTSTRIRSVPEAALKRRSVRLRHVQVQTTNQDDGEINKQVPSGSNTATLADKQACPHCRQPITAATSNRLRRPSCPPALSSGPALVTMKDSEDAKVLLAMIMKLKSQLEEEKQCRLKLEKAIHQRHSDDRREQLAKERDRWAGDCLWLNDRIALLPE
ncbi:hypothetical protein MAM1_0265c08927 [Mucor ambiguus]|uniref:Uncharacterized protein n=1 Tax=Mucor ambiguus TaxID=91626 RepID=A0A0C9LWZ8_9FUNG|nr:hypothetical protein MAM1_0265c08927 [Mucor ambiguus]